MPAMREAVASATTGMPVRNALGQYDELVDEWHHRDGAFAALHWLADSRAALIPPALHDDAVLVDLGCGGGVMADRIRGYRHVGVDLTASALGVARQHGVVPLRADVAVVPLADDIADVVVAGEILEHVAEPEAVIAEAVRIVRPGGLVVFDTIADGRFARFSLVTVGERMPGGPPRHLHDPHLFVAPERTAAAFGRLGCRVSMFGLRPSVRDYARFLVDRRRPVRMLRTRSLAGVYAGVATKPPAPDERAATRSAGAEPASTSAVRS